MVTPMVPVGGAGARLLGTPESLRSGVMVDDTTGGLSLPAEADVDLATETEDARKARFDRDVLPLMGPLYGNAMRLTRNADDAADLVQSTFERAYKGFHQYGRARI